MTSAIVFCSESVNKKDFFGHVTLRHFVIIVKMGFSWKIGALTSVLTTYDHFLLNFCFDNYLLSVFSSGWKQYLFKPTNSSGCWTRLFYLSTSQLCVFMGQSPMDFLWKMNAALGQTMLVVIVEAKQKSFETLSNWFLLITKRNCNSATVFNCRFNNSNYSTSFSAQNTHYFICLIWKRNITSDQSWGTTK